MKTQMENESGNSLSTYLMINPVANLAWMYKPLVSSIPAYYKLHAISAAHHYG